MRLTNLSLRTTVLLFALFFATFPTFIFGQTYTLTDNDVVVTNGVIQSCKASLTNKDVVVPNTLDGQTVTGIFEANWDGGVFRKKGIKSVVLPASMETIGAYAFADNSIESINFAQLTKLKKMGYNAFENNKLKEVDLSKCTALELIDGFAFNKNTIINLNLSGCVNLKKIGFNAFAYNQLATLDLSGCTVLENISPDALGNNLLTSFKLPIYQQANTELLYWTDGTSTFKSGETITNLKADYNAIFKPNYTPTAGELTVVNGVITAHKIDLALHPYIIIPETYNGATITGIGREAFKSSKLKSITLPSTLITIDYGAFDSSVQLLYIDITKCSNLKTIGGMAFNNTYFTSIDFMNCTSLETIKNNAFSSSRLMKADFSGCPNLKTIEGASFIYGWINTLIFSKINKLETIGDGAFNYCKLKNLDLSSCTSLISIGKGAFASNSITSFSLPTPAIAGFQGWKDNANKIYEGGATTTNVGSFFRIIGKYTLTDDDVVVENGMIKSCSYSFTFPDITIPSQLDGQTITGIVDNYTKGVFESKGITSLVLPNTITYLGKFAFNGNNIASVNFNELVNLESICEFTFSTNALTKLDFTNCPKLKLIDRYAFSSNSISSVVFPLNSALSKIGDQAFRKNNLRSIDLSKCTNLKEVHGYAFSYNSFSKFVLPINTGSNRQFVGWSDGTTIYPGGSTVEEKELVVYRAVFYSSYTPVAGDLVVKNGVVVSHNINVEENPEIVIPSTYNGETITEIGYRLFYESKLESITLPSTLVSINEEAFYNSKLLTKLDISKCVNLKYIGNSALGFLKITSLDLSTCPNIEVINDDAFVNCQLKTINLINCTKLGYLGAYSFSGNFLPSVDLSPCTSLKFIGMGAFMYSPMSGFKLPKSTVNGELVTTWVNEQNQSFKSESFVSNFDWSYSAKLNQINVYPLDESIEYGTIDRGKTHRRSFNIFNQSNDTLFIKDLILPVGFSVQSYQNYILPMDHWYNWVYFNSTENKDYTSEFLMTFSNVKEVVRVKVNANVNPNYDIKFVVRNETGALANATITIDGLTPKITDQNGEVLFAYVAPKASVNYTVEAPRYFQAKGNLNLNQHITQPITLELISYPVDFTITGKNQAIEGAKVVLEGYGEQPTNDQGKVSFPKVVPQADIKFSIIKEGYTLETGTVTVANEAVNKSIALTLVTCDVSIVCASEGSPVVGATVELGSYGQQLTNKEGIVLFEKVEPTDSIAFTVTKTGYLSESGNMSLAETKVEKQVELLRKSYNITLQCLSDGLALAGATVDLGKYGQQVSDDEGMVKFNQVLFSEALNYTTSLYGYAPALGTVAFAEGDSIQTINIDFVGYGVEFTVVAENKPIKDAVVLLEGYGSAQTNEDGKAVFNAIVSLDTLAYQISKEGFISTEGRIVPDAYKVTKTEVVLETAPVEVEFWCVSNGLPLADVTVELEGYSTQVSNAEGLVVFTNVAHADKLNYEATLKGYNAVSGTLTGITQNISQSLPFDLTTYVVTLWCHEGNKPLQGVTVELEGHGKQQTDENGKVLFKEVLPADSINYKIEAEGYQPVNGTVLVNDSAVEQFITMEKLNYTIVFSTLSKGLPLTGVTVELEGYGSQLSNAEGLAIFKNVAYSIEKLNYEAKHDGYNALLGSLTKITQDINQSLQFDLITYKVSFLVSEAADPISGAAVSLGNYGVQYTNENGLVVFDSIVPENSIQYTIKAAKYFDQTGVVTLDNKDAEVKIELVKDKTGIKDQPSVLFAIYPNPANRVMTIVGAEGEWITIYNNTGQAVLRHQSLSNSEQIDVEQIPNGPYLIKTSKFKAKLIVAHD